VRATARIDAQRKIALLDILDAAASPPNDCSLPETAVPLPSPSLERP
jgi:hypothetical protein